MAGARTFSNIMTELNDAITHYKEAELKIINQLIHDLSIQRHSVTQIQLANGLELISFLAAKKESPGLDFDAIDTLYAEFADHPETESKQKATWSYKRLQIIREKFKPAPDILSYEVKEQDRKNILDNALTGEWLSFATIYQFYPFTQDKRLQNPKNVFIILLNWLGHSTKPFIQRETILNKVCDELMANPLANNTLNENSLILGSMAKLIVKHFRPSLSCMTQLIQHIYSEFKNANPANVRTVLYAYARLSVVSPSANEIFNVRIMEDAFTYLYEKRDQLDIETLSIGTWAIAKLVDLKKYPNLNIQHFQELQNLTFIKIQALSFDAIKDVICIQHFLWSYVKVMEAGLNINVNEEQIKIIIDKLYELCDKANSQEISICLWSICKLIEMQELKSIQFERKIIGDLLVRFFNHQSKNPEEITNILYAMAVFSKENRIADFNTQIPLDLFQQLIKHPRVSSENIIKGLWAIIQMVEAKKIGNVNLKHLRQTFLTLDERDRRKSCLARQISEWFQDEELKNNNFISRNRRDPLFSASRQHPRTTAVTVHHPNPVKSNFTI